MIVREQAAMQNLLRRYRSFEESILLNVRLREYGTVLDLEFDTVWQTADPDETRIIDPCRRVTVTLSGVESVVMNLPLPPGLREDPSAADWGIAEIAFARVEPAISGLRRFVVAWESERRIDVSFRSLKISESRVS